MHKSNMLWLSASSDELAGNGVGSRIRRVLRHARPLSFLPALVRKNVGDAIARVKYSLAARRPDFWNELGRSFVARERYEEALACYDRALALRSDIPQIWSNRGRALQSLARLDEAEESLRQALRLKPDFANAWHSLGTVLLAQLRFAEAETSFGRAILLEPDNSGFRKSRGFFYLRVGQAALAREDYRAALCITPADAEIHEDLGMTLLLLGQFEEGWAEYEWRWKTKRNEGEYRRYSTPQWSGEPIADRVILLHAEQGLGDTLQFCRYAEGVNAKEVILEVPPNLVRLLSRMRNVTQVITRQNPPPAHDVHCSLLSLPYAFGTTLDTIPSEIPYLAADPQAVAAWQTRLACLPGLHVGLCWAGGRSPVNRAQNDGDDRRSLHLEALAPLGGIERVSFISLQKGPAARQADDSPAGMALWDFTDELRDFADTAALIEALDLVISVDTAVLHLAGALGKPVWLLNRFDTSFRWLQDRDDSPWYPSLRQFRQPAPGDWPSVIGGARDALQRLAAGDDSQLRPPMRVS